MAKHKKFRDELPENAPIWAKRINKLLKEKGITQTELAEYARIAPASLSAWITGKDGKYAVPKVDNLLTVAKYFDVSMDYLTGMSDSRKIDNAFKAGRATFGLTDSAMKRLEMLQERFVSQNNNSPRAEQLRNLISKNLISFILETDYFWIKFDKYALDYCEENLKNSKSKVSYEGITRADIVKYSMNKLFDEFVDDMFERLITVSNSMPLFNLSIKDTN